MADPVVVRKRDLKRYLGNRQSNPVEDVMERGGESAGALHESQSPQCCKQGTASDPPTDELHHAGGDGYDEKIDEAFSDHYRLLSSTQARHGCED